MNIEDAVDKEVAHWMTVAAEKQQEVERLRAELAALNKPVRLSEWQQLVAERDRLRAEVAALTLALENSGTRHEYTAPPGMVFVPDGFLAERDRLRELLRRSIALLREVVGEHADPDDHFYNECDKQGERCAWCDEAYAIIAALKEGK